MKIPSQPQTPGRANGNGSPVRHRKMSYIFSLAAIAATFTTWMAPDGTFKEMLENDLTRKISQKLSTYAKHLPEERIYLQSDRPFYEPGNDIWFSVYLREGESLKPSASSDIVHVELLNPKGSVEKTLHLIAKNGKAAGDFNLDPEAPGGLYKIRAYTNWMKNESESNCYAKEIQVQDLVLPDLKMKLDFERKAFGAGDEVSAKLELNTNENRPLADHKITYAVSLNGEKAIEEIATTDGDGLSYLKFRLPKKLTSNDGLLNVMINYNGNTESISRSIPILLNDLKFTIYPEGGDLLQGFENRVGFKALNEFGKPADVEGYVENEKGTRITTFSSYHQGMGTFWLKPMPGEKYLARITKPEGVPETYPLPQALVRGYAMSLDNSKEGELAVNINSSESGELALVAQVRGKMYYSTLVDGQAGNNKLIFSTRNFPTGVCQVTLFDDRGIARAERLAFVNKNKQLNVNIETESAHEGGKYLPREKVKMTLTVKDERGLPMPANLSMAVVNDQLLSFADDRSGNILSQLLLQQDLVEKVEEPGFYFDKKEAKADKALDLLLMTSGWRRFTWEKLLEQDLPSLSFAAEKSLVSGIVYDAVTGQAISNATIKTVQGVQFNAEENGKFSLTKLELYEPQTLTFEAPNYHSQSLRVTEYQQGLVVYLYDKRNSNHWMETRWGHNIPQAAAVMDLAIEDQAFEAVAKSGSMRHKQGVKKFSPGVIQGRDKKAVQPNAGRLALAVADDRRFADFEKMDRKEKQVLNVNGVKYYRARQFPRVEYEKQTPVDTRTDFRNTLYWNPNIEVGYSGKKTIEFYTSDDISSFRTTVEGMGNDGIAGRCEKTFFTQLPFSMSTKVPAQLIAGDHVQIPVVLRNNTNGPLGGVLHITWPDGLREITKTPSVQTIMPGKSKTVLLDCEVLNVMGESELAIDFKSCGLSDAFRQKLKIAAKGFPTQVSFSSQEMDEDYNFEIHNMVHGSLKASFNAFPNVVSDLLKGVEGILQEPFGCFEQTSCTAYPNAMVLDYLKTTDSKDSKTLARATELLDRGYKRLTSFETPNKGYEWFGADPAHEGLTAYGIMEFVDMQKAGQEIDKTMLDRTARWLLNHKNGKGGFEREKRALHDFGRISDEVLNGYIVYALSEAGYSDLKSEFSATYDKAMNSKDPYLLAMSANAAYALDEIAKGNAALKLLLSTQAKDGSFTGSSHSITYSQGASLTIETTALSILALLKSPLKNTVAVSDAVNFLVGVRSGSGVFSSTQGTILALKALTEYAKLSKRTAENGRVAIYVDGKKVAEKSYKAGDRGAVTVDGLEQYITTEGKHSLRIKYLDVKTPLPYSLAINWNTTLPASDKDCVIDLKTRLSASHASVGETVRLNAEIINKKDLEVPSTMAIIGIPAGFSAQAWQLKELQEKNVFDYYEIKGNNLALYYRGLGAKAVKEIKLDLKAEIPGEYEAPASSAYLYYTNEFKTWTALEKVSIHQ